MSNLEPKSYCFCSPAAIIKRTGQGSPFSMSLPSISVALSFGHLFRQADHVSRVALLRVRAVCGRCAFVYFWKFRCSFFCWLWYDASRAGQKRCLQETGCLGPCSSGPNVLATPLPANEPWQLAQRLNHALAEVGRHDFSGDNEDYENPSGNSVCVCVRAWQPIYGQVPIKHLKELNQNV